jgi:hypothetical protein
VLGAREADESFMSYNVVELRLKRALVGLAAGDAPGTRRRRAFEDAAPRVCG